MPYLKLDPLPLGVEPIKSFRSLGCSLVECHHHPENVVNLVDHGGNEISARFCRVCRSIVPTFGPVKMLAILPPAQGSLL